MNPAPSVYDPARDLVLSVICERLDARPEASRLAAARERPEDLRRFAVALLEITTWWAGLGHRPAAGRALGLIRWGGCDPDATEAWIAMHEELGAVFSGDGLVRGTSCPQLEARASARATVAVLFSVLSVVRSGAPAELAGVLRGHGAADMAVRWWAVALAWASLMRRRASEGWTGEWWDTQSADLEKCAHEGAVFAGACEQLAALGSLPGIGDRELEGDEQNAARELAAFWEEWAGRDVAAVAARLENERLIVSAAHWPSPVASGKGGDV